MPSASTTVTAPNAPSASIAVTTPNVLTFGHPELGPPDRLIHGDNRRVLASVPDASIDLIYIDPPFGTGGQQASSSGLTWNDVTSDPSAYVEWIGPTLRELRRVLARHGLLFVHLDWRAAHYVKVELDRLFSPRLFVNEIVWCYSIGGKSDRAFGRKHDTILCYAGSASYRFYPEAVRVPRKPGSHMRVELDEEGRPVQVKRDRRSGKVYRYPVHAGKVPDDYWTDIESLNRSDHERTGWPTQKPEALLERIIRAASAPGDLVADFFSGSGTTAVVAQRLGRRFLAVDESTAAIGVAKRRLEASGSTLAAAGNAVRDLAVDAISGITTDNT